MLLWDRGAVLPAPRARARATSEGEWSPLRAPRNLHSLYTDSHEKQRFNANNSLVCLRMKGQSWVSNRVSRHVAIVQYTVRLSGLRTDRPGFRTEDAISTAPTQAFSARRQDHAAGRRAGICYPDWGCMLFRWQGGGLRVVWVSLSTCFWTRTTVRLTHSVTHFLPSYAGETAPGLWAVAVASAAITAAAVNRSGRSNDMSAPSGVRNI